MELKIGSEVIGIYCHVYFPQIGINTHFITCVNIVSNIYIEKKDIPHDLRECDEISGDICKITVTKPVNNFTETKFYLNNVKILSRFG